MNGLPGPGREPDIAGTCDALQRWLAGSAPHLLLAGDAAQVLGELPAASVDMVMTSPPYWKQRLYDGAGIGAEKTSAQYLDDLLAVTAQIKRVLAPHGSFWLNLGDTYERKSLAAIPWRAAIRMIDEQGWILRNDVVWSKLKGGMDTAPDRLASTHEMVFHFVKQTRYHFHAQAIRATPRSARVVNGAVVTATGVSGVRYRRKIELSTELSVAEKAAASEALTQMLAAVEAGEYADFRMVIRGAGQRVTHSDRHTVSGRAKELRDNGYYFLKYHPDGAKPSDVWEIIPEDTQSRGQLHYAAYPVDLCRIPILATCPPGGIVLDPFVGTGTTLLAAQQLGRRGVGIDISQRYLQAAEQRLSR